MPSLAQDSPGWLIYQEEMKSMNPEKHALWEPSPHDDEHPVRIGDVGFVHEGRFCVLFSARFPPETWLEGVNVPHGFEKLKVTYPLRSTPRPPWCIRTRTIEESEAHAGIAIPTTSALTFDTSASFKLVGTSGAALKTTHKTYILGIADTLTIENYTERHYDSWVKLAKDRGFKCNPVLVTGVEMTKDFSIFAFWDENISVDASVTVGIPTLASFSAGLHRMGGAIRSPHLNIGPEPNPGKPATKPPPGQHVRENLEHGYNQCIFIRYSTLRRRDRVMNKIKRFTSLLALGMQRDAVG